MSTYKYLDDTGLARLWDKVKDYAAPGTFQRVATCDSTSPTAKVLNALTGFVVRRGCVLAVKFTYRVDAGATLTVNRVGGYHIEYNGANITNGVIHAGDTAVLMYGYTYWELLAVVPSQETPAVFVTLPAQTDQVFSSAGKIVKVMLDGSGTATDISTANCTWSCGKCAIPVAKDGTDTPVNLPVTVTINGTETVKINAACRVKWTSKATPTAKSTLYIRFEAGTGAQRITAGGSVALYSIVDNPAVYVTIDPGGDN